MDELQRLVRRLFALEAELADVKSRLRDLAFDDGIRVGEVSEPLRRALGEADEKIDGVVSVSATYERSFQRFLAGRELLDVRQWLGEGIPASRISEAIEVLFALPSRLRPARMWPAVRTLVRDTPPGQAMAWSERTATRPVDPTLDRLIARHGPKRGETATEDGALAPGKP